MAILALHNRGIRNKDKTKGKRNFNFLIRIVLFKLIFLLTPLIHFIIELKQNPLVKSSSPTRVTQKTLIE